MSTPVTASAKKTARDPRNGLRIAATLATIFTILGHKVFGFEQSGAHVLVALATGYICSFVFETVDAWANGRPPGFAGGGVRRFVDFFVSTHMTAITVGFLMYTNSHFWALALIVAVAIGSKYFLRVEIGGKTRHFMNPSNMGMVTALVFYQWTAVIPWGLTTLLHGPALWIVPAVVMFLGLRLNLLYTGKLPLIASFVLVFVAQAIVRSLLLGNPLLAELAILTNVPMALFVLYMITDPQTSPSEMRGQIVFGVAIATCYGVLMAARVNFTLALCLTMVVASRGVLLYVESLRERGLLKVPAAWSKREAPAGAAHAVAPALGANGVMSGVSAHAVTSGVRAHAVTSGVGARAVTSAGVEGSKP